MRTMARPLLSAPRAERNSSASPWSNTSSQLPYPKRLPTMANGGLKKPKLPNRTGKETETVGIPKYMMATKAIHQLGDISRDKPDICQIFGEDADNYIGNWVTGFG